MLAEAPVEELDAVSGRSATTSAVAAIPIGSERSRARIRRVLPFIAFPLLEMPRFTFTIHPLSQACPSQRAAPERARSHDLHVHSFPSRRFLPSPVPLGTTRAPRPTR